MATVFRRFSKRTTTTLDDAIFFDNEVSFKELGLYAQVMHLCELHDQGEWEFSLNGLAALHRGGIASVRSGIEVLEKRGYLIRAVVSERSNGIRADAEDQIWVVFDTPDDNDWDYVASQLASDGYEHLGKTMGGHAWPEIAKPQVNARVRKSNTGNEEASELPTQNPEKPQVNARVRFSNTGPDPVCENRTREIAKPQVNGGAGFPVFENRTQKDVYPYTTCKSIHPSYPADEAPSPAADGWTDGAAVAFGSPAPASSAVSASVIDRILADPAVQAAIDEVRALAVNRNRLREAPRAFAALVADGYEPREIVSEFASMTLALRRSGREDRFMPQLTKWLENDAADAIERKHKRSSRLDAPTPDPSGTGQPLEILDFDPASYAKTVSQPSAPSACDGGDAEGARNLKLAFLRCSDPAFDELAAKVGCGDASEAEVVEFNRILDEADDPDWTRLLGAS